VTGQAPVLFSRRFTWTLLGALVLPLLVRLFTTVEPFPAMLLPSGANLVRVVGGTVTTGALVVAAVDARGNERRLEPAALIDPIPTQYLSAIFRDGFGFERKDSQRIGVGTHHLNRSTLQLEVPRHVPSDADRQELIRWLRARVNVRGSTGTRLVARRDRLKIVVATGKTRVVQKGPEIVVELP